MNVKTYNAKIILLANLMSKLAVFCILAAILLPVFVAAVVGPIPHTTLSWWLSPSLIVLGVVIYILAHRILGWLQV